MSSLPAMSPARARLAFWGLVTAAVVDALGATMILPILPLFARRIGGSYTEVGVITAIFWAAGLAVRYPVGKLSDRVGRRGLIVGSQVLYAGATAALALSPLPEWVVVLRALQGAAAGAATVLSMAAVADLVPEERRGRAYGTLTGANMGGTIIGPLVGAALFQVSLPATFLISGASGLLVAAIIFASLPRGRAVHPAALSQVRRARVHPWRDRVVLGVTVSSIAIGVLIGMYDTVWSLLMHSKHASTFEIGLSVTLFALPFTIGSWPAGWLADRVDNRWLIVLSTVAAGCFACAYPFLPNPYWLIGLGIVEGIFTVAGAPARLAMLSRRVATEQMGEVQGIYGSAQTGAAALAALASGWLFGLAIPLPFVATAAAMWISALVLVPLWRGVDGRPHGPHLLPSEPTLTGQV